MDLGLVAGGFMVLQVSMNTDDGGQQVQNDISQFGNLYDSLFDETDTSLNIDILKSCNYISPTDFIVHNKSNKDFSVFSHNVRSLSNKWDDFLQMVNDFSDFKFSAMCLQEIWSLNPALNFTLKGYSPLYSKLRAREGEIRGGSGGGVGGGSWYICGR